MLNRLDLYNKQQELSSKVILEVLIGDDKQYFTFESFRKYINALDHNTIRRHMRNRTAVWGNAKLLQVYGTDKKQCETDGCFDEIPNGDCECKTCYAAELYELAGRPVPDSSQHQNGGHNVYYESQPNPQLHSSLF